MGGRGAEEPTYGAEGPEKQIPTVIMFYKKVKMYSSEGGLGLRKWETNDSTTLSGKKKSGKSD